MFQALHEISKNLIFVFVWKYVWKYVNINVSDIKKQKQKQKNHVLLIWQFRICHPLQVDLIPSWQFWVLWSRIIFEVMTLFVILFPVFCSVPKGSICFSFQNYYAFSRKKYSWGYSSDSIFRGETLWRRQVGFWTAKLGKSCSKIVDFHSFFPFQRWLGLSVPLAPIILLDNWEFSILTS